MSKDTKYVVADHYQSVMEGTLYEDVEQVKQAIEDHSYDYGDGTEDFVVYKCTPKYNASRSVILNDLTKTTKKKKGKLTKTTKKKKGK